MTYRTEFALALRRARERKIFTQSEFAEQFGIALNTYKNWERGICIPSFKKFSKLIKDMAKSNDYTQEDATALYDYYIKMVCNQNHKPVPEQESKPKQPKVMVFR